MKVNNGGIYYSQSNNKIVRVMRANQNESIAYLKHHGVELYASEVFFSDLQPVTREQVKKYLGK